MRGVWIALSLLLVASSSWAELKTEVVHYQVGEVRLTGYLAYDDSIQGKRPGILVMHEWWGHNDYVRKRAEMLARLGYTALALDMYGEGKVADHPDDAKGFMQALMSDMKVAEARFDAAHELLMQHATVDADMVAAMGYCLGGGLVLHMARAGKDLDGVVSYHGSLGTETPAQAGAVNAKVRVFNGAADPFVTPEQIDGFHQEMKAAGIDYQLINYPGVQHSFTNPAADGFAKRFGMPLAYDAEADADSWRKTQVFFRELFR